MLSTRMAVMVGAVLLAAATGAVSIFAQSTVAGPVGPSRAGAVSIFAQSTVAGPVGPSPYDVVRGWHKPFSEPGFAFGGNSGVFAESPNRIFVAQRGEARLPDPVPPGFLGFAGR